MAFSLRSFFGKGSPESSASPDASGNPANPSDPQASSPFSMVSPAPGNPPLSNSLLFKTADPSETLGQPVGAGNLSPFGLGAPASPQAGLTVGDLLPALPRDVAKDPGLPSAQP